MDEVDVGEWKFLCKVDDYNFSNYLSRLDKWEAIKITQTNIENNATFKVKRTRSKYDEVKDHEGNTHSPAVPALEGKLYIKQVNDDMMLSYDIWIDEKARNNILLRSILVILAVSFIYLIYYNYDFIIALMFSTLITIVFSIRTLFSRTISNKPYPGFTLKGQRVRLDYYLYQEDKGWLE